jgi:predicted alpha/beta-hydrolase family hydrolase
MSKWIQDGEGGDVVFLFAHGAGSPMDSDFMTKVASGLGQKGVHVIRFEFPYMQERREQGKKRPPNRMPTLEEHLLDVYGAVSKTCARPVVVGGKSMGGRVASRSADRIGAAGVVCFGYPFHPPRKPEKLRTAHLEDLRAPTLIIQGTRDKFGVREEVESYALSESVKVVWLEDGDHSFKPRKRADVTYEENMERAIDEAADFILERRDR